ncbi:hypothetical protein Bca4012_075655 [Brassica carinata]
MELGETDHTGMETDAVLELAEEFQNLTDGEGKDMGQVEATEAAEGGSNSKFVQVLMSPRKRAPAKQVRKGGGARPAEEKGPAYPKQLPKP